MSDGKTEMWGDPMLLPSRQHSQGAGTHSGISSCSGKMLHLLVSTSNVSSLGQELSAPEYLQRT